jgi:hypothetical protein
MGRAAPAGGAGAGATAGTLAAPPPPAEEPDYVPGPHAAAKLMLHCLQKSAQVGSVAAAPVILIAALRGRARATPLTMQRALRLAAGSLGTGTVALGAANAVKIASLDADGIADRVYRLHYSSGQQRTDRLANAAGLVASSVAAMALPSPTLRVMGINALGGFAAGTALGVFGHVVTSKELLRSARAAAEA